MRRGLTFDRTGFQLDGEDRFLVSGEFHYFRVPREDWRRRMRLFRESLGNCLATYVPWIVHEPEEGDIRFGDVGYRDLTGFLSLAREMDLKVILRPGPYQYSELVNDGLPEWLLRRYPQILARNAAGEVFRDSSVSYLHPVFLEKARRYYRAFAEQVRPFMAENGGPVCMIQVDNEMTGIHLWFDALDCNREAMGIGCPEGRYVRWLKEKYHSVEALNRAYGKQYSAFEEVIPPGSPDRRDAGNCRCARDYTHFYLGTIAEYACLLTSWLREDGLGGPVCHNSANPGMNCLFPETVKAMGSGFLLGSDHYYTLGQSWEQNNPTPQYCIRVLMSCDTLQAMGMPPAVMELPGGSPSDTPPILPEDLMCCYMSNLALGMKGLNYYVYTGGPNVPGTGTTGEVYDYNALVRADGTRKDTFETAAAFWTFLKENAWLQRAHRVVSVQVGFEWDLLRHKHYDYGQTYSGGEIAGFLEHGILYTLMCSRFSPQMRLLDDGLDPSLPLIVPCPSCMSLTAQNAVLDFLDRGGRVLLLPVFPETDSEWQSLDRLSSLIRGASFVHDRRTGPGIEVEGAGTVFGFRRMTVCERLPEGARPVAFDTRSRSVCGFEMPAGKGKLIWFGGVWEMSTFPQAVMLERFLEMLGARSCVSSSNRNVLTTLWEDDAGMRMLFALNPYSGQQSTEMTVFPSMESVDLCLRPMEVRPVRLKRVHAEEGKSP